MRAGGGRLAIVGAGGDLGIYELGPGGRCEQRASRGLVTGCFRVLLCHRRRVLVPVGHSHRALVFIHRL